MGIFHGVSPIGLGRRARFCTRFGHQSFRLKRCAAVGSRQNHRRGFGSGCEFHRHGERLQRRSFRGNFGPCFEGADGQGCGGDQVFLSPEARPNTWGASRYQLTQAVDQSLRRLQTDHIDVYYAHRWDDTTPIQETLRALDDLVRMGKVCYIAASRYASWQLAHANVLAELKGWTPFVAIQSEYNMLRRNVEREVLPYCRAHGVGFVPYFPLAGGFLTGKYELGKPPPLGSRGESVRNVQELLTEWNYRRWEVVAWAKDHGRGVNEFAQAWLLAQPQVCSVITGAKKVDHVLSNVKAADWRLSADELQAIDQILKGKEK